MIILDNTTRSLQVVLGSTPATNQSALLCSYVDITTTTFNPGTTETQTNGTTAVTIMPAPAASTQRQLKYFALHNDDTASITVTLQYNDSGTLRTVLKVTLSVGYRIEYTGEEGFRVYDVNGNLQTTSSSTANYYQNVQVNDTGVPQEKHN